MSPLAQQTTTPSETVSAMISRAAREHRGTAIRFRRDGSWTKLDHGELGRLTREIARGLLALGIEHSDRVAILSNTRPEWTYADLAAMSCGAVVAPVYQTNSPEECRYVLEHAQARLVFCEDREQLEKIERIRAEVPELEHVVAFEDAGPAGSISLDELRSRGEDVPDEHLDERAARIAQDDLLTIVYTSGTTGPPKGCMLTHGNVAANVEMVLGRIDIDASDDFYVFLPLAHVLTRVTQLIAISRGATLSYWQGDPKAIVSELAEVEPTILPSVPRIFEKVYTVATTRAHEAGGLKARMFDWAIGVGRRVHRCEYRGESVGPLLNAQHKLADRLVLSKVRDIFGGRVRLALTGAAPIDPDLLEFFGGAGVFLREGYGMTETSAVATLNGLEEFKPGTVGKPLPRCEVRIADDGEVLMRGPHIFKGYYRNEEATRETLVDGWLHSGDLGELDEGYLRITGRKKDLIVTSSGKNITPSNIENQLKQSRWVSQAIVYGDRRPYLVALLTLDPDEAPKLAEQLGTEPDMATLANDARVREELQKEVDRVNQQFARIEQVKKFAILERDLSQDEDELTPTMKVKRNVVYEQHQAAIDELYGD